MTEGIVRAAQLAKAAKLNDWHGSFDSKVVDGVRDTVLDVTRNGESLRVAYSDNTFRSGEYVLHTRRWNVHCASTALERLEGWPDLIKMFKWFPNLNRPTLTETYRKLPFTFEDSNQSIIESLIGCKLFWYYHTDGKIHTDVVLPPTRKNSPSYNIKDIGHRKLFNFIGAQAGFRSVLLDSLIKVG